MEFENTVLIELTTDRAMERLQELEVLNILKIVKEKVEPPKGKLSDKFRGFLNKKQGINLDKHLKEIRKEWERI